MCCGKTDSTLLLVEYFYFKCNLFWLLQVWINTSDIILVGLRDYQDNNKADVILKYNADKARSLKAYGKLPENAKINETDTFGSGDDEIQFDDIGDDDGDIDDI